MKKCAECDKEIPLTRSFCSRACVSKSLKRYFGGGSSLSLLAKRKRKAEIVSSYHFCQDHDV